jgi:Flp pilus assembly protein TadG
MALLATVVFFVVALVVDGSGLIQATQQADDIARSAARSAGQEIDRASLSGPLVVSHGAAIEAGQDFMSAAGCLSTSTVTISDDMVEATCDLDYRPVFTGLLASTTVRGQGRSQAVHVYEGVPK